MLEVIVKSFTKLPEEDNDGKSMKAHSTPRGTLATAPIASSTSGLLLDQPKPRISTMTSSDGARASPMTTMSVQHDARAPTAIAASTSTHGSSIRMVQAVTSGGKGSVSDVAVRRSDPHDATPLPRPLAATGYVCMNLYSHN